MNHFVTKKPSLTRGHQLTSEAPSEFKFYGYSSEFQLFKKQLKKQNMNSSEIIYNKGRKHGFILGLLVSLIIISTLLLIAYLYFVYRWF